jgi:hypothetical protein
MLTDPDSFVSSRSTEINLGRMHRRRPSPDPFRFVPEPLISVSDARCL